MRLSSTAEGSTGPAVALVRGDARADNIAVALGLLGNEIDLRDKSDVLIKVNFVSTTNQIAATHVDGVRALLGFLRERYRGKITIAESTASPAHEGFVRFGYLDLVSEYGVELVDLNEGEWVGVDVYDSALRPMTLRFSRQVAASDYRISIGPPKTHDAAIVTLSIKNLAMGSLHYYSRPGTRGLARRIAKKGYRLLPRSLRRTRRVLRARDTASALAGGDKRKMHQGHAVHNLNLYLVAKAYPPHLSIVDGFVGMEGNGPTDGDPVDWKVAIASQDPVAADCLAATLMGFQVSDVGYLWYCHRKRLGMGDIDAMDIRGSDVSTCFREFQRPPTYEAQRLWGDSRVSQILEIE